MTGPDPWPDEPPDPLEAALDRYARAFPKAGLPFLRGAAGRRMARAGDAPATGARCGERRPGGEVARAG